LKARKTDAITKGGRALYRDGDLARRIARADVVYSLLRDGESVPDLAILFRLTENNVWRILWARGPLNTLEESPAYMETEQDFFEGFTEPPPTKRTSRLPLTMVFPEMPNLDFLAVNVRWAFEPCTFATHREADGQAKRMGPEWSAFSWGSHFCIARWKVARHPVYPRAYWAQESKTHGLHTVLEHDRQCQRG
jgi:hypothetical protein